MEQDVQQLVALDDSGRDDPQVARASTEVNAPADLL